MSAAAKSVMYFGFYLYMVGAVLIFIPNFLLSTLTIPETSEVWIRVAGVLVVCIAYYYHRSGSSNDLVFCRQTIPTRIFVCISFLSFALLEYVSPVIIIFGVIDLLGAIWTWTALRNQRG